MPSEATRQVKVLTLNTWGLWLVSKDRLLRMKELGHFLRTCQDQLDLVLLQEVWVDKDANFLMRCAKQSGLQYGIHFKSGIFGSGLVTLSRYPILESGFHRYSAAGDAAAIHCGDFLAGKGVGWLRLALPDGTPLMVFNTHLHANYSHKHHAPTSQGPQQNGGRATTLAPAKPLQYKVPRDGFAAYRISQIYELAQIMRHVGGACTGPIILGGDLNTKPHFLEIMLLRHLLPELVDCWTYVHGEGSEAQGFTCRADGSTYRSTRQVPERIDYVLVAGLVPQQCDVTLKTTRAGCSYSDHCAVQATLTIGTPFTCEPVPATRLQGSVGLAGGRRPWALYSSQGQHLGTAPDGGPLPAQPEQQQAAVLQGLQRVLPDCLTLLPEGSRYNKRHSQQRFLLSALLLLVAYLACGLPHCPRNPPTAPSSSEAGIQGYLAYLFLQWCSALPGCIPPLMSAVAAGAGVLAACIAAVPDVTQARVLQQTHVQLSALAALVLEDNKQVES